MAFSHVPVALKMILQSGSIGKAANYVGSNPVSAIAPHTLTRSGGQAFNLEIRVQVPLG